MNIEKELKTAIAETTLTCDVQCPHCGHNMNILSNIQRDEDVFGCDDFDHQTSCSECKEVFIVEEIIY